MMQELLPFPSICTFPLISGMYNQYFLSEVFLIFKCSDFGIAPSFLISLHIPTEGTLGFFGEGGTFTQHSFADCQPTILPVLSSLLVKL